MKAFTKREINRGRWALSLSYTLVSPSDTDLKWICQSNSNWNNPVIPEYSDIAYNIWGKDVKALVGKGTKQPIKHVDDHKFKIPRELEKLQNSVLIVMDILFVNGIPFFLSLSRKIYFTGVSHLPGRSKKHIFQYFKELFRFYIRHVFLITTVHSDGKFAPLKPMIEGMPGLPYVNVSAANKQAPDIEQIIRVVKEQTIYQRHSLPFKKIPKIIKISCVVNVCKFLNVFLPREGSQMSTAAEPSSPTNSWIMKIICVSSSGNIAKFTRNKTPATAKLPGPKAPFS